MWTTTCIVTNFGSMPQCTTLINPANPNLTGPNTFPYFPRGGPQPRLQPNRNAHHIMGYVSQWGGMDSGSGMMFSAETIDGLVHQLGGLRLRADCSLVPAHDFAHAYVNQQTSTEPEAKHYNAKCPVGAAAMTSAGGDELRKHYDNIIHTTPPFYNYPPLETDEIKQTLGIGEEDNVSDLNSWAKELLRSCYRQSFKLAFENDAKIKENQNGNILRHPMRLLGLDKTSGRQKEKQRVAVPLLGAGCRSFPTDEAISIAALESASWLSKFDNEKSEEANKRNDAEDKRDTAVVFGLLEEADAEALSDKIEKLL